jgi:uncharacterized protein (DUF433 family)
MHLPEFLIDHPDGEIRLTGSRISLYHVVSRYRDGVSVQEMANEYSWLPPGLVQKVIDFYLDNREEVDAYVDAYQADLDRQEAEYDRSGRGEKMRQVSRMLHEADEQRKGDPDWERLSTVEKLQRLGVKVPIQED